MKIGLQATLACGLCLLVLHCAAQRRLSTPSLPPFHFVQISDPHLGPAVNNNRLDSIVAQVKSLPMPVTLTVVTGDMLYNPADSLASAHARARFAGIGTPIVFVAGNHDVGYAPDPRAARVFRHAFGALDTTFVHSGIRWVIMNSNWMVDSARPEADSILDVFEQHLRMDGLPKIVLTHIPPCGDFHRGRMHPTWRPEYAQRFESLANAHRANVLAVLTGHFHRNELHWAGKVPVYVAGPVARNLDRQPRFRVYYLKDGNLGYHTIHPGQ